MKTSDFRFIQLIIAVSLFIINLEAKLFKIEIHDKDPVCKVDDRFLSIAVGTFHARQHFKSLDFSSQKLKNVISALRPAYLRLGGSDSNFLVFRPGPKRPQPTQPTVPTTTQVKTTTSRTTTRRKTTTEETTTRKKTTTEETTTRKKTTTEETTTRKKTTTERTTRKPTTEPRTTEQPTTKAITEQPTTEQKLVTTPHIITTPQIITTPRPTQAATTQARQWTPAPTLPGTTPPQIELPNINIFTTSSPISIATNSPWGVKNSKMEENDSKNDDQESNDKKDYEKGERYYAEDLKEGTGLSNNDAKQNGESLDSMQGMSVNQTSDAQQISSSNGNQETTGQAEYSQSSNVGYYAARENAQSSSNDFSNEQQGYQMQSKATSDAQNDAISKNSEDRSAQDSGTLQQDTQPSTNEATQIQQQNNDANTGATYEATQVQSQTNEATQLQQSIDATQSQTNEATQLQGQIADVNAVAANEATQSQQRSDAMQPSTYDATQSQQQGVGSNTDAANNASDAYMGAAKRNQMILAKKRSRHQKYPFWLPADEFDRFVNFVERTGLDLIFDINGFFRRPDGSWDATNAMDLLRHVEDNDYRISWEMGNEPNRYKKYGKSHEISALQNGLDMIRLRSLLMRNKKHSSKLIGPGVSRPGTGGSEKYLEGFLNIASWAIDAVTWHQYYVSKYAKLSDFTSPSTLDLFKKQILKINKVVEETKARKPVWLGETGSAWGGGAPGISDTFAASFMFLDKLGLAGLYCNQVVIRQSLLGGSYALLDDDFTPRPDYWVGLVHKKLVGRTVFRVSGGSKYVRVYAHCTRARAGYPRGAITVFALNLNKKSKVELKFKNFKQNIVDQYLITPSNDKLRSKNVDLNGEEMRLAAGLYVPKIHPIQAKMPVTLPPMTIAFYVIPFASSIACM